MISWINRHITHNRDDEGDYGIRLLTHIPAGILIGLCLLSEQMFLKYERNEDVHTEDEAWKDIAGAMVGRVIGRAVLIGIVTYLFAKFVL
mgnify:CR=1 FL=1